MVGKAQVFMPLGSISEFDFLLCTVVEAVEYFRVLDEQVTGAIRA